MVKEEVVEKVSKTGNKRCERCNKIVVPGTPKATYCSNCKRVRHWGCSPVSSKCCLVLLEAWKS